MTQIFETLKRLLSEGKVEFWAELKSATFATQDPTELISLAILRRKAMKTDLADAMKPDSLRLAVIGAYSFHPLVDIAEQLFFAHGWTIELFEGSFDNYQSEVFDSHSPLKQFEPGFVFLMPSQNRCRYTGGYLDSVQEQRAQVDNVVGETLQLCEKINKDLGCEVLLANFVPSAEFDPGQLRTRSLAFRWAFQRMVNLDLGMKAPPYVTICDLDFLASRRGLFQSHDDRAWLESKQPGSPNFVVDIAGEMVRQILSARESTKKVLVLDLDNTLWGGVIGDVGLEGIEIGDTSPRGEAFKAFQRYVLGIASRGVLLAVCSKNDYEVAIAPFEKHPEMLLKRVHFSAFKANWEPKSENIRAIANELNLGLDSFVFLDDNPAEIEIVRQFVPAVETILVGPDPSDYVTQLDGARFFEPRAITSEDAKRTEQYRAETERRSLQSGATDMESYLSSLQMKAVLREFNEIDLPRISQLINKSNQFNLTTRRRSEAEVKAVMDDKSYLSFSFRLDDRFGDHGLISVFIGKVAQKELRVDTWLMSCRVLKRQVEEEFLNEVVRLARIRGCDEVVGEYIPTAKNKMVRSLLPDLGFTESNNDGEIREYRLSVNDYQPKKSRIQITRERNVE
jgi:FkbH-like protein